MVSRETIWIWIYFKLVGRINIPIEVPVLSIWLCWGVLLYSQAFILGSLIWRMSTFKESIEALGRDSCLLLMTPSQVTNKHHKHSGIGINVVFIGFICWVLTTSLPPFPRDYTWWLKIWGWFLYLKRIKFWWNPRFESINVGSFPQKFGQLYGLLAFPIALIHYIPPAAWWPHPCQMCHHQACFIEPFRWEVF